MIFKYRYDIRFKQRVKLGKAFICEKHFSDDDIQRTVTKSWIKIGCLPSANIPVKSHQSILLKNDGSELRMHIRMLQLIHAQRMI